MDDMGNRWCKCIYCGLIDKTTGFASYGGPYGVNGGKCGSCSKEESKMEQFGGETEIKLFLPRNDPSKCPVCGGKLREKNGRRGKFMGCDNYPKCTYTRTVGKR